jgi:hypothetical protein
MDRVKRISNRFPRFYKLWEEESQIFNFIRATNKQLDESEEKITDLMKAHWVDTAVGDELDWIGVPFGLTRFLGEDDSSYRIRLKRVVNEYMGGGTVSAIREAVRALVNAKRDEDVKIVENPPASGSAEFTVSTGDTWTLGSNSIRDEKPSLTLSVEEGGGVRNPRITNLDTDESIGYKGTLKSGQKLVMGEKEKSIEGVDASKKLSSKDVPRLPRKIATWKYNESLQKLIGVFDEAKFDEHTFAVGVPSVKVRFDWGRLQPATFEVQIKSKTIDSGGISETYLEKILNQMKAAGVKALIKISG